MIPTQAGTLRCTTETRKPALLRAAEVFSTISATWSGRVASKKIYTAPPGSTRSCSRVTSSLQSRTQNRLTLKA